jgi:hypothetical protein
MTVEQFDTLVAAIARARTRRAVLAALAGSGTIGAALDKGTPASAGQLTLAPICRGFHAKCKRGGQCCSGQCRKRRGKNKKKKGHCRCSTHLEPCHDDGDCCLLDGTPLVCASGKCQT